MVSRSERATSTPRSRRPRPRQEEQAPMECSGRVFLFSFSSLFSFSLFLCSFCVPHSCCCPLGLVVRLRTTSVIQSSRLPVTIFITSDARTFDAISIITASTIVGSELRIHLFHCLCTCEMLSIFFTSLLSTSWRSKCCFVVWHTQEILLVYIWHIYPYSVEKSPTFFGQSPLSMDHSTRFMTLIFRNCLSSSVRNRSYSPCLLLFSL